MQFLDRDAWILHNCLLSVSRTFEGSGDTVGHYTSAFHNAYLVDDARTYHEIP